ncbi:MAG: MmgE/PrpD family protein [Thermoplasmata archaeon]
MELDGLIVQEIETMSEKGLSFDKSEEIKKRLYDTIISSWENEKIFTNIKKVLNPSYGKYNSTFFFSGERGLTEYSSLYNTMLVEKSLFKDFYPLRIELHPSVTIPVILAHAENEAVKGHDVMKAINASYQISTTFAEFVQKSGKLRSDVPLAAGMAAGIGLIHNMEGNTFQKFLAYSMNLSNEEKYSQFSKSFRSSFYARDFSFLYRMIGEIPDQKININMFKDIEGEHLLDFRKDRVSKTVLKYYPVDDLLISAVEAATSLREKVKGNILDLRVEIPEVIYSRNVRNEESYNLKNIEDLERSLKFIISYVHFYGPPRIESYNEAFITDINIKGLTEKIKVSLSDKFDNLFPEFLPTKLTYETDEGIFEKEIDVPYGYYRNPISWNDLKDKGFKLLRNDDFNNQLLEFIKNLDDKSVDELMEVMNNAPVKGK